MMFRVMFRVFQKQLHSEELAFQRFYMDSSLLDDKCSEVVKMKEQLRELVGYDALASSQKDTVFR